MAACAADLPLDVDEGAEAELVGEHSDALSTRVRLMAANITSGNNQSYDPGHGKRVVYTPTEKALDLMPVLLELLRWGTKYHAKANAPAHIVKGASENRDGLIAELRSLHGR